ncbi:hypothetical protein GCM10022419_053340 [Nonomuraea rosea]|uniref:Uncharacterized protein n=1 Tax=Nonomuraea rosea TaxID=638574 RepID=A0ABP6XEG6_9ACTN
MADQFDVIESGERGRRRWIGLAVVLALLLIPIVGVLSSSDPGPPPVTPAPEPIQSLTRVESAPNILNVPVKTKGRDEVFEAVFPDGQRAEVRYPAELDLDAMGSRPFVGVWVDGLYRQLQAPYNGEIEVTRGGRPIRNYTRNVTLWPRQAGSGSYGQVLLFAFGQWRLAMYDRGQGLTFDQRLALARELKGRVTKNGYLVLSARGLVRLAEPGESAEGYPVGPQLWFGGGAGPMVAFVPTPGCRGTNAVPSVIDGRGRRAESVCKGGVRIAVTGPQSFRERALKEIQITLK